MYARLTKKVSDDVADYQRVEDFLLRYIDEKTNDQLFDYEAFMNEALAIYNKYPELKDPNELIKRSYREINDYNDDIFTNLEEPVEVNDEKLRFVDIVKTLKALKNNDFTDDTKMLRFHNKVYVTAMKNGKLNYDDFKRITNELSTTEW